MSKAPSNAGGRWRARFAAPLALALWIVAAPAAQGQGQGQGRVAQAGFADLASAKLPAVVTITASGGEAQHGATQRGDPPNADRGERFDPFSVLPESPLRDFLEDPMRRQMPDGSTPQPRRRPTYALGSGFVIDPTGYVVTNNHVVEKAEKVEVTLSDTRRLEARIVGTDPMTDLALLKVSTDRPLPAVHWGDSGKMRVGDWVVAIGNPFGLGGTVTAGIISARARHIGAGPYDDFIQTDAAINRGNSGGPMFNLDGDVVGVNAAIFSQTGGSIGIGFAIPSSLAGPIVAELRDTGRVTRGWLGVGIQPVSPEIAEAMGLKDRNGALVASVTGGSPAAMAGLESGDLVTEFAGKPVQDPRELSGMVARTKPGATAKIVVQRGGDTVALEARIAELQPSSRQAEAHQVRPGEGRLGMTLAPVTPELRNRFGLDKDLKGAVVVEVVPDSPAANSGLEPGDVITRVGQAPVDDPGDVAKAVDQARQAKKDRVILLRQREDGALFIPVPIG